MAIRANSGETSPSEGPDIATVSDHDLPLLKAARLGEEEVTRLSSPSSDPPALGQTRGSNLLGNRSQVPDESEPAHDLEQVESDIDFPPEEPLARRRRIVVVVVVPALSQREERKEKAIPAFVSSIVSFLADKMGH